MNGFVRWAAALLVCFASTATALAQDTNSTPLINRIRMATLGVGNVDEVATWYSQWLGYRIIDVGKIDAATAASWAASNVTGHTYVVLASAASRDVPVRLVQVDVPDGAKVGGTFGWSGIEVISQDVYAVYEKLKGSPVDIIRPPSSLGGQFASIHAMQVQGPAGVVVAITTEKGDQTTSNLPEAKALVDRIFLVGINGPDVNALRDFYIKTFRMRPGPVFDGPSPRLAKELGLPDSQVFPLTLVRAAQRGNTVELHGLPPPAKARPHADGQLPPGTAIVTFGVASLDGLGLEYLSAPIKPAKTGYGGARAATFIGPAGELIELIEEK